MENVVSGFLCVSARPYSVRGDRYFGFPGGVKVTGFRCHGAKSFVFLVMARSVGKVSLGACHPAKNL